MNAFASFVAGCAAVMLMVSGASAQVAPPGARDIEGDDYLYPVLVREAPVLRVTSTTDHPHSEPAAPMAYRNFPVPPSRLGAALDLSASAILKNTWLERLVRLQLPDARIWLQARGVTFPPGAMAIYLTGPQRLVVRNTQVNLDRVESLVAPPPIAPVPSSAHP